MFEIAAQALAELDAGRALGVVVVTGVHGSTPRTPGSAMAVTADGRAIGAISGGCIEAEAYELAREVLASGDAQALTMGGEGDLLRPGLACGGAVDVVAVRVGPGDETVVDPLRASLGDGAVALALAGPDGPVRLERPRAPRLVIVGAVDFTPALASAARLMGFRVVVVDPRPVFATPERVPDAHEVIIAWPDAWLRGEALGEDDAVCVLTHDDRLDVPALEAALATPVLYVGAMGSRRVDGRRREALAERGVGDDALARLRSPIGLDLGGSTPAETAIAIMAEVLLARAGGTGLPLREVSGPIHRRQED
ncbi:XdhC family protein [Demequina lignilytica]|uniref:XdhC family protein n=1 Tax=Demequina lignilytica TaxID=3051663 RepID=A0AB35MJU9_9MICO|nr:MULTISPECIES: XdhC/CoxI family protein [unclassified Demequina]MDN4484085.1 XdhC family protein [Demequina sp. SYSU T0a273]MDN4490332.1 XdhC family protein [Demequina sp. SYSU T00068]